MQIEVMPFSALGPVEVAAWARLQAADPALSSPYFSFGYAAAVAAARPDARVAVIHQGGTIAGFFAVQGRGSLVAQALGVPLSDYQGLVGPADLPVTGAALCTAFKVGRIDFTHALAGRTPFGERLAGQTESMLAPLAGGAEAYRSALKARNNDTLRQQDKKRRKIEREIADLRFTPVSADQCNFNTLIDWKADHCRRTGQPVVWATPWVRQVVDTTFASQDIDCRGVLFSLRCGDRLIAANYFLASRSVLHDWIIAHDSAFDRYSPGVVLARMVAEWAADHGYAELDFGPGDYLYKRQLTTARRPVGWGSLSRPSASAAVQSLAYTARKLIEAAPNPTLAALPGKAMRRIDVVRGLTQR